MIVPKWSASPPESLKAAEIVAGVEEWKLGNRIRIVVELFGFIFSIMALRVWSAENALLNERAS